jgi:hypothetical protein
VAGLRWWLAAADRPSRSNQVPAAADGGKPGLVSRWLSVARGGRGSRGSPWFPLRFNQLKGVRWRGRLLGPGAPSQSSGPPGPVCVYDVLAAVLTDCTCPFRPL